MRLDHATWPEVDAYLADHDGIILPVGSTEQHGPMGLIGTDATCARAIAEAAAEIVATFVAPTLAYTPAPFNTGFPGTVSISEQLFADLFAEIVSGLQAQGFRRVYVLNAHGANLAPMRHVARSLDTVHIRSWWEFDEVNALRQSFFGQWEGMHATPAEISITQFLGRRVAPGAAATPPRLLTAEDIASRAGDRHGPPDLHRREFPDGRVGSHSALATPEYGAQLLQAAARGVAADYQALVSAPRT